jgi:hypothetical protein
MNETLGTTYPGELTPPRDLVQLARCYEAAADQALGIWRLTEPMSAYPARLLSIHAIELYLAAFLRAHGQTPKQVRAHMHDVAGMAKETERLGLVLRTRTQASLEKMVGNREYLVTRYDTDRALMLTEMNRVFATMREVGHKVRVRLK